MSRYLYNFLFEMADRKWAQYKSTTEQNFRHLQPEALAKIMQGVDVYHGKTDTYLTHVVTSFKSCMDKICDFKNLDIANLDATEMQSKISEEHTELYNEIGNVTEFIKSNKPRYIPAMLPAYIKDFRNRSQEEFDRILEAQKQYINSSSHALGDEQKKSAIAKLEEQHKKALETFNKEMDEQIPKLEDHANKEDKMLQFIMLLMQNEKNAQLLKATCNQMAHERFNSEELCRLTVKPKDYLEIFPDVLEKLDTKETRLYTKNNTPFIFNAQQKTVSMTIPCRFNLSYWDDLDDKLSQDLNELAMALKAQGLEEVVIKINHNFKDLEVAEKDPDYNRSQTSVRMQVAHKAYQACINQGFPADKIKIVVNGVEIKNLTNKEAKSQIKDAVNKNDARLTADFRNTLTTYTAEQQEKGASTNTSPTM